MISSYVGENKLFEELLGLMVPGCFTNSSVGVTLSVHFFPVHFFPFGCQELYLSGQLEVELTPQAG